MERDSGASQPNGPDQVLEPSDPQEFFWKHGRGWQIQGRIGDSIGNCLLLGLASGIWKDPPFFMGKSTISMAIFNSYVKLPEGSSLHGY